MIHLKSFLFATSILSSFLGLIGYNSAEAKTLWLEEDDYRSSIAQGDAEEVPAEFLLTDEEMQVQTQEMQKAAANSVQAETVSDEKIPTITAEGGFLLPTYVLPEADTKKVANTVAPVDTNNPWRGDDASSTPSSAQAADAIKIAGMTTASQPNVQQNQNVDTQLLKNIEKQYQDTTQLLADTAKRLAALESGVNDLKEKNTQLVQTASVTPAAQESVRRQPLLLPLAPVKTEKTTSQKAAIEPVRVQPDKVLYIDYVLSVLERVNNQAVNYSESDDLVLRSIPQELKLNFLPNSADISTQSFKWIKAFSYHPKKSMADVVEIRMSAKDLELQSRRFALIKGALLSNGLAPRQIRFVLTDRDPDSIVLRNVKVQPEREVFYERQQNGTYTPQIIQKW